jgi:hypothetical protein
MTAIEIGEYVTVDYIKSQIFPKWIVLTDLKFSGGSVDGGVVRHIEKTKAKAGDKAAALRRKGTETYLTCGSPATELIVGGVFIE